MRSDLVAQGLLELRQQKETALQQAPPGTPSETVPSSDAMKPATEGSDTASLIDEPTNTETVETSETADVDNGL